MTADLRGPGVIGEIALVRAELDPDSEAVVDGPCRLTWAELAVRTNRLANGLAGVLSVRKGDRVAYVGSSCLEAFELWHAVPRLGARFDPAGFFRAVEAERATNVLLAPTMLRMLLDHGNAEGHDLASLRTIVYGGAPMPRELLADVLAFFPCALVQGYGSTEAGQMLYLSDADHRAGRLHSNGRAVPGVDVSIRAGDGAEAPDGEVGELHVRSPQLMAGYWLDPDKTAEVLRDGWYGTGDLCTRDPDGDYRLVGRASDMIISGGFNIMPSEVEQVLSAHPSVREVAVYGVADRMWGEAVHATVVLEPGAGVTADDLISLCRQQLAAFKRPRTIEFVAALPLTAAGKIDKAALARQAIKDGRPTS